MGDHGMGGRGHEMMGGAAAHGSVWPVLLAMVLFAVLAAAGLFVAHRKGLLNGLRAKMLGSSRTALAAPGPSEAEAYVDMLFARGEIDVAEYHERRSALKSFA